MGTLGVPEFLPYGESIYGEDLYGDGPPYIPILPISPYGIQSGYCPQYLRFQFSGIRLPLYIFDQNPISYDGYPQRTTQSYKNLINPDPTIDEPYQKIEMTMTWDRMPESMWNAILPYTRKKVDGSSEPLYFWDGQIGRFKEGRIKVESFRGEVRGGYFPIDRFNVSLKMRVSTV